MLDIQVVDQYSLYSHFLELTAPYFPIKNFQFKDKIGILNVQFKNQPTYKPLIYIYFLSTNSYEGYKNTARQRLMKYFDDYPAKNSIILFFPSLLRVDEKVNKILQQTHELICQDLQIVKQFPKEKVQKIIFYDSERELNKEQCMREFLYHFQLSIQQYLESQFDILENQIYDQEQLIHEKSFSFYKLYALKEKKAKIYENISLKQEAIEIYVEQEKLFMQQYPKTIQPIFNAIHPFDFLVRKSVESNIRNFEESGDESQSTILDYLVLIQYRIIDLLSGGNQIFGVEKILQFSEEIEQVVHQQIEKNKQKQQFNADEEELWGLGLLIWQFFNMRGSINLMTSVPQNISGNLLLQQLQSQLKIRFQLLNIVEKLGYILYKIQFNHVRRLPLSVQCELLEQTILEQINEIKFDDVIITRDIQQDPKELFKTYLLSDTKLKGQIHNLHDFSEFYCQIVNDIISIAIQLNLHKVIFEYQFMILKLKNVYPKLELNQDNIDKALKYNNIDFKNLNSSLLVHKLIYYYREKMELSFQETFKDTLQSNLSGCRYTKLFQILKLPLTKLKSSYIGYFETFQVRRRVSYNDFAFNFSILKYLQVECDGIFTITLKNKVVSVKDKKKLRLTSDIKQLRGEKKVNFEFKQQLNSNQGGLYSIRKVTFLSGPFKLYFDVSQKVQQLRLHLMHPLINIQNIATITNIGTPILLSVSDLPVEITEMELTIISKVKIASELFSLRGSAISQKGNTYKVVVDQHFLIQHPFVLILYAFEEFKDQQFKLIISVKNHQFATNLKVDSIKLLDIIDLSDKIDEDLELYELRNNYNQNIQIDNGINNLDLQFRNSIRQVVQKGQLIFIKQSFNFKETFQNLGVLDDSYFEKLEELYCRQQSLQKILNIKKSLYDIYQMKKKSILFKVQFMSAFNQERFIPYTQSDYFDMAIKIQYVGEDEGLFQFELISHHPKQNRKWKDTLSQQKTLSLMNFKCFLTGTEDFEKPQLRVNLLKEDKSYEIDEKYIDNEFTLSINEQSL
ncbi:unnamed protein product [Paramecium sonneborni]|uniref:TRAPPC10/Trs130 N-terminal domain-containing protein n=1 Tax=Paramecium sonneborni TaxID=65129 RepID=A0A8S1KZR1_9CILI|nr:unnamed protein product [Paramecium sonneborni]